MTPMILTRRQRWLAIALLALTAYAPTLRLGFLWDDHVMIENNPNIARWTYANLRHDFTSDAFEGQGNAYYRPVQLIFSRLDYTIWRLRPFGYHLTNLLFHAANGILIAELALAISFDPLSALLSGCLFAVHPIGVEQLMIIAGRAELMGLFFMLISLLSCLRPGRAWLGAGASAYLLGLFSKESVVITPAVFALLLWYRRESGLWKRVGAYAALTIPYLMMRTAAVGPPLPRLPPVLVLRFFAQAFPKILVIYTRLILVPWNLHSHRAIPHLSHFWPLYLLACGLAMTWLWLRRYRFGLFCAGWFLLNLLPKVPIMMVGNFTLDHWAYPAAAGVIFPLAKSFAWLWETRRERWLGMVGLLFFPILLGWALLVHLNVALRGTDEKMYRWALQFTPSNPIKCNLGILLLQTKRAPEAFPFLEECRAAYPADPQTLHALAVCYWEVGRHATARKLLEQILHDHPAFQPARQSLRHIQPEK